jgi:hypothetical protein
MSKLSFQFFPNKNKKSTVTGRTPIYFRVRLRREKAECRLSIDLTEEEVLDDLHGELDQWVGHYGKADDYHYHLPPTHFSSIVGEDQPIAYALDGFPIYGETTNELDEYLGILNADGSYQYHTIKEFPYFMAGTRGEVSIDANTTAPENQILPQAMTTPMRGGDYGPLSGATITSFSSPSETSRSLAYEINGETLYVNYSWDNANLYTFTYVDANGGSTVETYQK